MGLSAAAPAPKRYHTRVGPTPPSPPHPRPSRRAPPYKRAQTSSPRESFSSRPQEPKSPPHQGPARAPHLDLSLASIIRRPLFHCNLILGNADCSERDMHDEVYYDLLSFSTYPELRDTMILVQRYSLEPFMTPRQFFYPLVVIEFYHTMTSRRESNPIALHFSIDSRSGILRASDITATFNLSVCHAPDPGPTRLANPNRFRGAKPYTGTPYLFILYFIYIFFELNLYRWYTNNFCNNQQSCTFTNELPLEWYPLKFIHIY